MNKIEYFHQNEWDRSVDKENVIYFDLEASPKSNPIFNAFVEKIYDDCNCKILIAPKQKLKLKQQDSLL